MIDSKKIKEHLSASLSNLNIITYDSVTSTNDLAKELAKNNPQSQAVILASNQTKGRGTKGRTFFSPDSTGIYMSALLRPEFSSTEASLITPYAALCVAKAIEKVSKSDIQIKWVNDIYANGKKAAGILCESSFDIPTSSVNYVIVGIGINAFEPDGGFPIELKDIATSIFQNKPQNGDDEMMAYLCASILNELYNYKNYIENKSFIKEYKKRLCMLNKDISVITPSGTYPARAIDVDENARLIVELPNGETRALDSGEITIRQKKEC